ncbi:MAG: response regulator [Nitrospirota bacterium]
MNNNSKIQNPNSKILRILLIEDNPGDARLIKEMLKESGVQFEIESADRLSAGIGQVKLDGFDVILLDLGLPDSQGLGTLRKLNEIRPKAPVIVLTGLADEAVGTQAVKEGAQDYLIKGQIDHNLLSRSIKYAIERAKVEAALRESNELFSLFMHHSPIYTYIKEVTPTESRVLQASENFQQMIGISGGNMIGKTMAELFPPEFAAKITADDWTVVTNGEVLKLDEDLNGRNYTSIKFPILQRGKILLAGYTIDITERKRLEEAIMLHTKRFETFFDTSITLLAFLDKDFNFIRVNKAYANADEKEISYFPGRNHFDLYPSDAKAIFEEVVRTKTAFQTFGRPFIYPDHPEWGVTYWNWTLVPILDNNGAVEFLAFSLVDVTEQKKAEENLKKSEAFIKNILESVGEGFIVIDPEYKIISANKAYCEMQKASLENIIGRPCYEVSHRTNKPCFMDGEECAPKLTFKTGEPHLAVHTHYDKEDNPIYIETRSYPMKDDEGKVFAVIEILNNVTEKRTLENQLRHAQKMEAIGQLAGGIAHDFNNMLNVIIGYASLMQMNMSHEDPKLEQVKEILNAGDRAAHLTKGLLTFSRKQVMEVRRINLNEIIEGFKRMLARIIGEDIELRIIPSEQALTLKADIVQIEQVLLNLASNAKDAMPKGGILTIETMPVSTDSAFIKTHGFGEPGVYALITVSDTGEGMDDRTREKIFEPFFTTKEFGKGTGLGLSIVYGIIKQHNGYINCYSEPGKGTTFKIYLPLIKEEAEKVEIAETELPKGGTETILVAEDDASVRDLTKQILEGFGYTVIEAVDGIDAVNKFKENKDNVHLLLFDLIMPNKNGKDAYEDIQGIRHDIKVIFTSGYAADIIQRFGIEDGIDFISKPVSPHELLRKVRDMLG